MYYLFVFSVGIFSVSLFPFLIPIYWLLASFFCLLVCWYRRWLLSFFAGFGFVVGSLLGHHLLNAQLPLFLEGQVFKVTGTIEGLPKNSDQKERFTLRVNTAKNNQGNRIPTLNNRKIQLAWYYRNSNSLELKPGQIWNFTVKLKRPRGFVNPAGFDYQAYLLQHKISATGYVLNQNTATLLGQDCGHAMVSCIRWLIKKQLLSKSSNPIALGPILALLIGDTSEINQQQWTLLRSTGTIHLFAISGLHIGIAAAIGFFVGRLCMKLAGLLFPFCLHVNYFPGLMSIFTAALYSLLAGLSLPTQRALSMVVLFHLFSFFNLSISPLLLLAWALTIVALLDPLAIYNQGFWLSFLAVSLLLYGFSGYKENYQQWIYRFLYSLIKSQWILAIGLFFPSIILLQGISLSAPIVNLLAVPLVSLFIVPLLFLLIFLMVLSSIGFFNLMYSYCY